VLESDENAQPTYVNISVVVCYKQRVYRPAQLTTGAKETPQSWYTR